MCSTIQRVCLGALLVFAMAGFVCGDANAGEPRKKRRGAEYDQYRNSGTDLLDAVNRDHGIPKRAPYSGVGHGPYGRLERNPYEPGKWLYNEAGMIDAINRDHGIPQRAPYSGVGHGPTGQLERNPYDPSKWRYNETGMLDAINRDHPPVYVYPR